MAKKVNPLPAFSNMKFGCDPELFIFNTLTNKPVPALGIIPGTKEEPYKVRSGAVQVDGTAAEFNIDPATSFEEFSGNIDTVLSEMKKFLPENHELRAVPYVIWDKETFESLSEQEKDLGCSPDYNAWTGSVNPKPIPNVPELRTASGHIHIGWSEGESASDEDHVTNCRDLVKQLDYYLGAWSVKFDPDAIRRSLYGQAGALRYKPYGVEYRVLSNFWVLDPSMRILVWNQMQRALNDMHKRFIPDYNASLNDLLIDSIKGSFINKSLASYCRYPIFTSIESDFCYG